MIVEDVDRRVLGALRLVDAITGQRVTERLDVAAAGVTFVRNLSGDLVIRSVTAAVSAALRAHGFAFGAAPAEPAVGALELDVRIADPRHRYLPRRVGVALPRDPDPTNASSPDSLFQPVIVRMHRSAAGAVAGGWSVIRAHVTGPGGAGVLAGALIRVLRASDDTLLGGGVTDERGEALIAVAGVPVTTFDAGNGDEEADDVAEGPVLITSVPVTLQVVFDEEAGWPPDPDDLEARAAELEVRTVNASLRSGEAQALTI
jgi:hypothetical protein